MVERPPKVAEVKLRIQDTDLPEPVAVNWAHFAYAWPEVQMYLGYLDLYKVHLANEAVSAGRSATLAPEITHRFQMSARGFLQLKSQVDEAWEKLKAQGVITEVASGDER
jgi:hypothetical protein